MLHPAVPLQPIQPVQPVHLDDATISVLLDPASVTDAMERAFAAWGRGEAATTQRVRASASGQMASAMAAVLPPYSGGKLYATREGVFTFVVTLFDDQGTWLCTLDGDALTRARTPAGCALAVRRLAVTEPRAACVLGTGRQALPHLRMLAAELPGVPLRLWGRRADAVSETVTAAEAEGIAVDVAPFPEAAADGADVIVTVTSATAPVLLSDAVSDRALVCAVGATKHDRCEIDPALVGRVAAVVCDDAIGSRVECGDLIRAERAGLFDWSRAVELHDLVAGNAEVPRAGAAPVLFETQGVALQDVAAAGLAWERWLAGTH
jgi:ornithine cyclodeaminase/alanine dehydrogenase-like protein (mu-crystallin family)